MREGGWSLRALGVARCLACAGIGSRSVGQGGRDQTARMAEDTPGVEPLDNSAILAGDPLLRLNAMELRELLAWVTAFGAVVLAGELQRRVRTEQRVHSQFGGAQIRRARPRHR